MCTHRGCFVILTLLVWHFYNVSAYLALNSRLVPHHCRHPVWFPNTARCKTATNRLSVTQLQQCRTLCAPLMSVVEPGNVVVPSDAADKIITMYQFARPHTIYGTILASVMVVLRALSERRVLRALAEGGRIAILCRFLPNFVVGILSLLLGNIFIVGINQIFDINIDKINKPFLPMAAGRMSSRMACMVVAFSGVLGSLLVTTYFSKLILGLYLFGLLIGGLYSAPPVRLKRYPAMAALIIAFVRGFVLHFGIYTAVIEAFELPFIWNRPLGFVCRFMPVFAGVIAVIKDLPDVEGDSTHNITTFASQRGVGNSALVATVVLGLNYASAIVEAMASPAGTFNRPLMAAGHTAGLVYLIRSFRQLNADSKQSIIVFYGRMWQLLYYQYILLMFL